MADEAVVVENDVSAAQTPLVTVSFQRNDNRKQKYLEAEPKALGITQVGLSLFNVTCASVYLASDLSYISQIPFFISSVLVLIAGSVAIAAQNLHLPTLRACLGMQIVACGASFVNMIYTMVNLQAHMHFYAESVVVQAALFAISVTLAAYCCKVVKCCAPDPKIPVITVQAPLSNSQETGRAET